MCKRREAHTIRRILEFFKTIGNFGRVLVLAVSTSRELITISWFLSSKSIAKWFTFTHKQGYTQTLLCWLAILYSTRATKSSLFERFKLHHVVSFLLGPVVSIFTYLLIVLKVQNMPVPEVLSSALSAGLQPNKGRLNLDDQYSLFMYEIAKLTL